MNKKYKFNIILLLFLIFILFGLIIAIICSIIYSKKQNYEMSKFDINNIKTFSIKEKMNMLNNFLKYKYSLLNNINIVNENLSNIPIYYINLDRATDRNKIILDQIEFYNINKNLFTRISGVDGKLINEYSDFFLKDNKKIKFINKFNKNYYNFSNSEIACTLSHIKSILYAYENNDNMVLIMEDDIGFGLIPFWKNNLLKLIDNIPNDWDIISLANGECDYNQQNFIKHIKNKKLCFSTVIYLINRKGMKKILSTLDKNIYIFNLNASNPTADFYLYDLTNTYYLTKHELFFTNNHLANSSIHDSHTNGHINRAIDNISNFIKKFSI